jgi:type I restriction enzyme S subunit
MKPGYKKTEVGVIPEEWEVKSMDSLTSLMTNGFVGTATSAYVNSDDGILYIQGYNVQEGGFNLHGIKRISKAFHTRNQKSCLREGDLLTIQTGDIGVTTIVPKELLGANCHALVISRFIKQNSDPLFYCHYFNSERGRAKFKEIETGSTMKHLNVGDMKPLLVPSPPLPEQSAIATALSDVDELLTGLTQLIAKKRDLKQAAMQQLLTGTTRLPGFSGKWEVKRLEDVADVKTGPFGSSLHERDYVQDGTPIITVEHLGEFGVEHFNLPLVSDSDRHRLRAYSLEIGDIVFSRVGSVDRNALIRPTEAGWLFSGRLLRVRPDTQRVHASFLSYHFHGEAFIGLVRNVAVGQTMACLNTQILKGILITLPSLPEQTAIAEVLSDMDAEIATLETRLEKTRALKQGMMQELLTGRIRLV